MTFKFQGHNYTQEEFAAFLSRNRLVYDRDDIQTVIDYRTLSKILDRGGAGGVGKKFELLAQMKEDSMDPDIFKKKKNDKKSYKFKTKEFKYKTGKYKNFYRNFDSVSEFIKYTLGGVPTVKVNGQNFVDYMRLKDEHCKILAERFNAEFPKAQDLNNSRSK